MIEPATTLRFAGAGKRFDETWAVRDLNLNITGGSIVGLIGPSGCGKTTTIRLGTGAYQPDEGEVRLFGDPPHELTTRQRAAIGYLPQEPVLFEDLSVRENLNFLASLNGVRFRRRDRLRELLALVDMPNDGSKLVSACSGGMKRRLALAGTLAHNAPILVLDEPTAGIDPILRRRFWDHFRQLRNEGRTLVIATQYVGEAVDCDTVVLLAEAGVVATGSPEELRQAAYGGDVIEIETERSIDPTTFEALRDDPDTRSVTAVNPRRIRIVVADGGVAITKLVGALGELDYVVLDTEEVVPDYDDVFVKLVASPPVRAEA